MSETVERIFKELRNRLKDVQAKPKFYLQDHHSGQTCVALVHETSDKDHHYVHCGVEAFEDHLVIIRSFQPKISAMLLEIWPQGDALLLKSAGEPDRISHDTPWTVVRSFAGNTLTDKTL